MAIRTQAAPKPPVNPAEYRPSRQVRHVIGIIAETIRGDRSSPWTPETEIRFNDGVRHGQAIMLRALVELETRITDSDTLDQLIGDMMEEATAWQG